MHLEQIVEELSKRLQHMERLLQRNALGITFAEEQSGEQVRQHPAQADEGATVQSSAGATLLMQPRHCVSFGTLARKVARALPREAKTP